MSANVREGEIKGTRKFVFYNIVLWIITIELCATHINIVNHETFEIVFFNFFVNL